MICRKRRRDMRPSVHPAELTSGIGDECEAYLAGELALYLRDTGHPVPPVGWLNQVVHATPPKLVILANGLDEDLRPPVWQRTVGYLSRSLLERARETGRPIEELQRDLLVPLELELFADVEAVGYDPADMIRVTLTRLYELPELSA